jgi:hypothetical protein
MATQSSNDVVVAWFPPVLAGPFVGAAAFATLKGILALSFGAWIVYLLFSMALAVMQVIVLAGVDVALLYLKLRKLPTGKMAWYTAIAAPVIVGLATGLFPKPEPQPAFFGFFLVLIAFVPMVIVSTVLRLVFGEPIERG